MQKFIQFFCKALLCKKPPLKEFLSSVFMLAFLAFPLSSFSQVLASGKLYTQTNPAQNEENKLALRKILLDLESQYKVSFHYDDKLVKDIYLEPKSYEHLPEQLENSLQVLLSPFKLKYKRISEQVYVIQAENELKEIKKIERKQEIEPSGAILNSNANSLISGGEFLQGLEMVNSRAFVVEGKVTAETNEGLPGVNVLLKGTTTGTTTNSEGNYTLTIPDGDGILVFSYIGYTPEEILVNNRSVINVSLVPDIKSLSEVVVVGYGTQKRQDLTGSISSVKGSDISSLPVASVTQALQGQMPGVEITTNNGAPGSNMAVRIRGVGTVNSTEPLYVVDGLPVFGGVGNINPNDIESIDVLKDASAGAIYGSRAANGVVIITTKKGKEGPLQVSFQSYYGTQSAWKKLDLLNAAQYRDLLRETAANVDKTPPPAVDNASGVNTDWQDLMFRTAPIQSYNVNLSGGGKFASFNISGGYFRQDGILIKTRYDRANLQVNSQGGKGRFKFGESLMLSGEFNLPEANYIGSSMFSAMISSSPLVEPYNPANDGGYGGPTQVNDANDIVNPFGYTNLVDNKRRGIQLLGSVYGQYEIFKGLTYKLNLGTDLNAGFGKSFTPTYNMGTATNARASLNNNGSSRISWLVENTLTYSVKLDKHDVTALAGYSEQYLYNENFSASAQTFPSNDVRVLDAGSANKNAQGSLNELGLRSYFLRGNYAFDNKYLLTATVRQDGSSRFGKEYRYGTFPSLSVGWVLSEESFFQVIPALNFLKLRASYGMLGNQEIGNYQYVTALNLTSNYVFGDEVANGVVQRQFANPDAKWETTKQTDIGIDVGLLQDKLMFSADYYQKQTEDMLIQVPIPLSTGNASSLPFVNAGGVSNKGVEFALTYKKSEGNFRYSLSGNFSTYTNEVTSLGNNGAPIFQSGMTKTEVGSSIGRFYGWITDGLYQNENEINKDFAPNAEPGDIRFRDLDGDGKLTDKDRDYIGSPLPKFSYGLSGNAGFSNFDFSFLFYGVYGNEIVNTYLPTLNRFFNTTTLALDRWTPTNTNRDIPRAALGDPNSNSRFSNRFIEKGSFLRLRNVTLGYTLPKAVTDNLRINNVRVYVSAQNLLTFTNYTGYDPEIAGGSGRVNYTFQGTSNLSRGIDSGIYPLPRTLLAGLQVNF